MGRFMDGWMGSRFMDGWVMMDDGWVAGSWMDGQKNGWVAF